MKQTLFLLSLLVGIAFYGRAQTTDTTSDPGYTSTPSKQPVSPALRAAGQLSLLQKKLNLNQDQVIKLRMVLLNLSVSLDSLRTSHSADRKGNNQARRAITQDADGKIYAALTTDQQVAYAQWKQEQQLKRKLRQAAGKAAADSSANKSQHP
jgi:hypothetical protein